MFVNRVDLFFDAEMIKKRKNVNWISEVITITRIPLMSLLVIDLST